MNLLPQASTFATRADQLFLMVFVLSTAFLVFITGLMIYFVVRYSRKRHPKAAQIHGHTGLEITWTLVPLGLFLMIFYFGWTNYDYASHAPRDAMVVKVTGRQWTWSFLYPNGKQTNRLYAAIDRPVKLEIQSADVIHGFYVPAFRIKADAMPGRTNTTWFQATELGSYDIQCTVICGVDHSLMLSTVEVVPETAFKAWYFGPEGTPEPNAPGPKAAPPRTALSPREGGGPIGLPSVPAQGAGADNGEHAALALMRPKGCFGCHSTDGTPMTGPTLKGLLGRREEVLRDGKPEWITVDEERIALAIREPLREVVRGFPPMPEVRLEPTDVDTIVDYIKSIQ
ncbi:MAG TPA: cytochrome c oxidase subunit II [Polyangiaceae bacterium]|nr:cytochrome c oxidase subunit II [Polyangiaceae bacterium]